MAGEDQKLARNQGLFGGNGLGKDPTIQTTIATIALLANWLLVAYTFSQLGTKDTLGNFKLLTTPPGQLFYTLCIVTIAVCIAGGFLIQYKETSTRWGARIFACLLPAALTGLLLLSALAKTN
jgi:hypothetical protein